MTHTIDIVIIMNEPNHNIVGLFRWFFPIYFIGFHINLSYLDAKCSDVTKAIVPQTLTNKAAVEAYASAYIPTVRPASFFMCCW